MGRSARQWAVPKRVKMTHKRDAALFALWVNINLNQRRNAMDYFKMITSALMEGLEQAEEPPYLFPDSREDMPPCQWCPAHLEEQVDHCSTCEHDTPF